MKKLLWLFILAFSVVLLAGCWSEVADNSEKESSDGANDVVVWNDKDEHWCIWSAGYTWSEEKEECVRAWEEEKEEIKVVSKKEYQMKVNMVMTKDGKNTMEWEYKIYKKDGNAYTEIVKFGWEWMEDMPFKPVATLNKWWKSYTQMEINWEKQRFEAEDMWWEDQFGLFDDKMFDADTAKAELKNVENVEKSEEEFDGNDVECHSFSEDGWKVKVCINEDEGYVAYIESEFNWEETLMSVSDFDDDVDGDMFETPKDVKPMAEIWKMMMGDELQGMMDTVEDME